MIGADFCEAGGGGGGDLSFGPFRTFCCIRASKVVR